MEQVRHSVGYVCIAVCLVVGMMGFGKFSLRDLRPDSDLIEVKGLSERIVDADVAEIQLTITNESQDIQELYKKKASDKKKVMECLQRIGFEPDVYKSDFSIDYRHNTVYNTIGNPSGQEKICCVSDKIFLKTTKFGQIENLKSAMSELGAEGIVVEIKCNYRLTDFEALRFSMINEAAKNARDSAEAAIKGQGGKIAKLAYFKQGAVTIASDTDSAAGGSDWERERAEMSSFKKKVRLVVRAGFKQI